VQIVQTAGHFETANLAPRLGKHHPDDDGNPRDVLQSLFEFMIEIVNRHHGVINKFLGDGFMPVFGAPLSEGGDCLNAVAAAR
jgi:class 3 adenylate cyclase